MAAAFNDKKTVRAKFNLSSDDKSSFYTFVLVYLHNYVKY